MRNSAAISIPRTRFSRVFIGLSWIGLLSLLPNAHGQESKTTERHPNIIFAIADDWGWPHASAYGDPVVKTPTFDRIAREGVLFLNAFVSSPSCTPSRNAILTGQHFWRLGWGANLWSKLDTKHVTFPLLLEESGYFVGHVRKSWGPGKLDNWAKHPAGPRFPSAKAFFEKWDREQPFCLWFGSSDPHRPYRAGSGVDSGMKLDKIQLFEHFPDSEEIRSDVADYYWEVQRFDREVGEVLRWISDNGLTDNTIVVMTGDHGMPFPRCKANVYDSGSRVPMAVRWPTTVSAGRTITDFVSTTDIAPTFLAAAQAETPSAMTGKSWLPLLQSNQSGRIDSERDRVFIGKERHVPCQEAPDSGGTPMRAIRTDDFLLIHNVTPARWPAGTPNWQSAYIKGCWYADIDNGPTKSYMVDHWDRDEEHRMKFERSFGKRAEWELYDMKSDPGQMQNVADQPAYAETLKQLKEQLQSELVRTGDPRVAPNTVDVFEKTPYFGRGPRHPDSLKKK